MRHYLYYVYEQWGRGYIGRRKCKCDPKDDRYMGSYRDKTFNPTEKIILCEVETYEEACAIEVELHAFFEVDINPHFANIARQTSAGFNFRAEGENNPNYGGGNVSIEGRQKMRESTLRRLEKYGNPFAKKGKESQSHGRKWVTNSDKTEEIYLKPGEVAPEGWIPGRKRRPPRSQESRNRTSKALKGKKKSDSHRKNLSKAAINYYKNLKLS